MEELTGIDESFASETSSILELDFIETSANSFKLFDGKTPWLDDLRAFQAGAKSEAEGKRQTESSNLDENDSEKKLVLTPSGMTFPLESRPVTENPTPLLFPEDFSFRAETSYPFGEDFRRSIWSYADGSPPLHNLSTCGCPTSESALGMGFYNAAWSFETNNSIDFNIDALLTVDELNFESLIAQLKELEFGTVFGAKYAKATYFNDNVEFVPLSNDEELELCELLQLAKVDFEHSEITDELLDDALDQLQIQDHPINTEVNGGKGNGGPRKGKEGKRQAQNSMTGSEIIVYMDELDLYNCVWGAEESCLIRTYRSDSVQYESMCLKCDTLKFFLKKLVELEIFCNSERFNRKYQEGCAFCAKSHKSETVFKSHVLRFAGIVCCPLLRNIVCQKCGATGSNAHTISYCPEATTEDQERVRENYRQAHTTFHPYPRSFYSRNPTSKDNA